MKASSKTYRESKDAAASRQGRAQIAFGVAVLVLLLALALAEKPYERHAYGAGYSKLEHKNIPPFLRFPSFSSRAKLQQQAEIDYFGQNRRGKEADLRVSRRHLLGTDAAGNDMLASIMEASHTLLLGGVWAALITFLLGMTGGILIGNSKSPVTVLSQFALSVFVSFPPLVLLLLFLIMWGFGSFTVMTAIGVVNSPRLVKIIAKKIRLIKNQEFIAALQEAGLPHLLILGKHILWNNCRKMILVQLVYAFASAITLEISLSFLGIGIMNRASLGHMVGRSWESLRDGYYWEFVFPIAVIIIVLLGLYFLGDGINRRFQLQEER